MSYIRKMQRLKAQGAKCENCIGWTGEILGQQYDAEGATVWKCALGQGFAPSPTSVCPAWQGKEIK